MDPSIGMEAVELIAHFVGCQLRLAEIRGQEANSLRESGYYKKVAALIREWREAVATGDGAKVIALLRERAKLRSQRREITAPFAPARAEVRERLTLITKVAFPETLARAGVEPILPEI